MLHVTPLGPFEHRIFDFQKNVSQKEERRRKKELESSQDTETTKKIINYYLSGVKYSMD